MTAAPSPAPAPARLVLAALLLVAGAPPTTAGAPPQDEPARTAGEVPAGVLRFEVLDDASGAALPGRLTFVTADSAMPELFPVVDARPKDLAVRKNVVYTLSGRGAITVPAGAYRVFATRGPEWSRAELDLRLAAGEEASWSARLRHVVDTTGWIGGDFHLHTLTFSGHGDSNLEERVISLAGEGVEFAVATDHNHNTDYGPTVDALGAQGWFTHVTGNELSTPIGHFNAFPLDPARPPPDPQATDANELFRLIRAEPNRYGVTPVVQVNHPRWLGIDYFTQTGLDPVTGTTDDPDWSLGFDTVEVFNANSCWGYYDADKDERPIGAGIHSVLEDWFHLLNRGAFVFAVGNSDSHTVHHEFAGYPRNYVSSSTDVAAEIDPGEVAAALRAGRSFTTTGPFLELRINGRGMGELAPVPVQGVVQVNLRVSTPEWIHVDRARVYFNGEQVHEFDLTVAPSPQEDGGAGWHVTQLQAMNDGWIVVAVEGDTPLDPVVTGSSRPILPLALANPVWVDVDGDGRSTPLWEQVVTEVRKIRSRVGMQLAARNATSPTTQALFVLAAVSEGRSYAPLLMKQSLSSRERVVRLAAVRGAEALASPAVLPGLDATWALAEDVFEGVARLRAMRASGTKRLGALLADLHERFGAARLGRYDHELVDLLPAGGRPVWRAVGYFPSDEAGALLAGTFGPEADRDAGGAHPGKGGAPVGWADLTEREDGFLDLRQLDPDPARYENAVAFAQTWVHSPDEREVLYAMGSDDGCRLWIGDELVYETAERRGAAPLQRLAEAKLRAGWNRVLLGVENGNGAFGLYFRVLDDEVRFARRPE